MQRQIYFIKKKMIDGALRFRFQRGLQEREGKKKTTKNKLESTTQNIEGFFFQAGQRRHPATVAQQVPEHV